jgi:capsular polysaccharide biosynthesis protein
VERFPARWHVVHRAAPLRWPPPRALGSGVVEFELPSASRELGVLELEGGSIFGRHGWVAGANGALLPELSWYGGPNERIRVPERLPEPLRVDGACLSVVSDWSCRNYSHFLLDGLGRLALFLEAGFSLDEVDHVYCPTPPTAAASELVDRLGIPAEKRIWASSGLVVEPEVLFVPSLPATARTYPQWLPRFLRRTVLRESAVPAAGRRLYVSRRGYGREAVDERELEALVRAHGFEVYEAREQARQPDDFDQAEIVVGAHGAGLANLAFCRPGTRVIEIVPTDNARPYYYSLALAGSLEYGYLVGRSLVQRGRAAFGPSPYDFDVDLDELAAALA